jgi:hypothetical protein
MCRWSGLISILTNVLAMVLLDEPYETMMVWPPDASPPVENTEFPL